MKLQELREQRLKLIHDAQEILLNIPADEAQAKEQRARADRIMGDVATCEADIANLEKLAKMEAESRQSAKPPRGEPTGEPAAEETRKREVRAAFEKYIRFGKEELSREERTILRERRDITTVGGGTNINGSVLIPQEFLPTLIDAQKLVGNSVTFVRKKVTNNNGAPMKIALSNDTGNTLTTLTAEATVVQEQDPTYSGFVGQVDTVATLVKVSIQELEDSAFDLNAWIRDKFGIRYFRGLEYLLAQGNGSNVASMVAGATLAATTAANTGPVYDDYRAAYGALEPAYIPNARWVMNQASRVWTMGLKDTLGRPLFIPSPNSGTLDQILGLPICLNQALPSATTPGAVGILLGDLNEGYLLRTDGDLSIRRLDERFIDTLEVGFLGYARIGGYNLDAGTHPILKLATHA